MNLIDTLLERIAFNNRAIVSAGTTDSSKRYVDRCAGRREAYEHVLCLLGFYDDELEPIYTRKHV
jgi:hypothetical protein